MNTERVSRNGSLLLYNPLLEERLFTVIHCGRLCIHGHNLCCFLFKGCQSREPVSNLLVFPPVEPLPISNEDILFVFPIGRHVLRAGIEGGDHHHTVASAVGVGPLGGGGSGGGGQNDRGLLPKMMEFLKTQV